MKFLFAAASVVLHNVWVCKNAGTPGDGEVFLFAAASVVLHNALICRLCAMGSRFYSQQRVSCCTTESYLIPSPVRSFYSQQRVSCCTTRHRDRHHGHTGCFYSQQRVSCCTTFNSSATEATILFLFAAASVVLHNLTNAELAEVIAVSIRSSECRAAQQDYSKPLLSRRVVSIRSSECRAAQPTDPGTDPTPDPTFLFAAASVVLHNRRLRRLGPRGLHVSIRSSECRAAQLGLVIGIGVLVFLFAAASVVLHNLTGKPQEQMTLASFYSQQRVSCCTTYHPDTPSRPASTQHLDPPEVHETGRAPPSEPPRDVSAGQTPFHPTPSGPNPAPTPPKPQHTHPTRPVITAPARRRSARDSAPAPRSPAPPNSPHTVGRSTQSPCQRR